MPAQYFQADHEMATTIPKIPPKAVMADSGEGGLLGALITATGRADKMKAQLAGLQGETISELMRQSINRRLESKFFIGDEGKDLLLEVNVLQWGWYVPTTVVGIKTGAYQCQVTGACTVYDLTIPKKKSKQRIAFSPLLVARKPLGNDPEDLPEASVKKTMIETVDAFTEEVAKFVTTPGKK
jgi:hypothetical protein